MKRVKIYRPKVKEVQDRKSIKKVIENKKAELIGEKSVMDKTLSLYENAGDDYIINMGIYMEEDKNFKPKVKKAKKSSEPEDDEPSAKWNKDDIINYMIENEIDYDPQDKKEILLQRISDSKETNE